MKKILILCTMFLFSIMMLYSAGTRESAEVKTDQFIFTDDLGRTFTFSHQIERLAPSGNPSQMILRSVAEEEMVGTSVKIDKAYEKYFSPYYLALPTFGTFYGRKANLNRESVILASPDVVIDMGEIKGDKENIANDLDNLSRELNIPVVFIECYLDETAKAYRRLSELIGKEDECEERAQYAEKALETAKRKKEEIKSPLTVYYSSSPDGLVAIESGSFHSEVLDKVGLINVVPSTFSQSSGTTSLEQIILWDPDVILLSDKNAYTHVLRDPSWNTLKAVKEKRVYLIPTAPYSFIDSPPSINRLIGIYYLGTLLYPDIYSDIDIREEMKSFYSLFYHYELNDGEIDEILNSSL